MPETHDRADAYRRAADRLDRDRAASGVVARAARGACSITARNSPTSCSTVWREALTRDFASPTSSSGARDFPAKGAPFIAEMAAESDVAISGVGHCGSSSPWSVIDAVNLEKAGVPAVALISRSFCPLGQIVGRGVGHLVCRSSCCRIRSARADESAYRAEGHRCRRRMRAASDDAGGDRQCRICDEEISAPGACRSSAAEHRPNVGHRGLRGKINVGSNSIANDQRQRSCRTRSRR